MGGEWLPPTRPLSLLLRVTRTMTSKNRTVAIITRRLFHSLLSLLARNWWRMAMLPTSLPVLPARWVRYTSCGCSECSSTHCSTVKAGINTGDYANDWTKMKLPSFTRSGQLGTIADLTPSSKVRRPTGWLPWPAAPLFREKRTSL